MAHCLSACLLQAGFLSKRLNRSSWFLAHMPHTGYRQLILCCVIWEFKLSTMIRVLPSRTLSQTLNLANFLCLSPHTSTVASVVNLVRQSLFITLSINVCLHILEVTQNVTGLDSDNWCFCSVLQDIWTTVSYYRTQWTAEGSVFGAVSLCNEISPEPLNGFAPNSHGRRVWSLAQTSLKVKVTWDKNGIFRPFPRPACGLCLVKHL